MARFAKMVVILVAIVAISLVGYVTFAEGRPPAQPDYRIVPVTRDTVTSRVSVTGSIEPVRRVNLTFRGAGRVAEVLVESGQRVDEGQLLARLDARDMEISLEQAKTSLEIAKIQMEQLQAGSTIGEIAAAQASVASARAAYERTEQGPSPEDIASARAGLDSSEAALRKLRQGPTEQEKTMANANLEQARIALEQAQASYDKVAWVGASGSLPQSLQLQQATINYEAALANYELATQGPTESQIKAAEAQVAQARSALEKVLNSPTASELALAEAQVVQAEANLDRLLNNPTSEQVRVAEQQVRQAELAVAQATLAYEGAQLIAPFAGVIGQVNLNVGETAPPGQPAIVLVDLDEFYVDVSVDEIDVTQIAPGQEVILTFDALPDISVSGQVDRVNPVAQLVGGIISYQVRIGVKEPDARLRAGMTAIVDITTARHENVLTIPGRAMRLDRNTGKTYVEKLVNGRPVETEIEIGLRGDQLTEVKAGLQDGDEVIIRGVSSMEQLLRTFGG